MVEAHAQSVEDYLIEGLSYKLSPGASYVSNRRSVSFFPSGSDTYSPSSGVKVIRIKVNTLIIIIFLSIYIIKNRI